jgi:hypothetical protein
MLRQSGSTLQAVYVGAACSQHGFQSEVVALAAQLGGQCKLAPLKGLARAQQKVTGEYDGDAGRLLDVLRASVAFESVAGVYTAMDVLRQARDVRVKRVKDRFRAPCQGGYRDVLVNVTVRDGQGGVHVAELQLHHVGVLAVKRSVGHKLYAQVRTGAMAAATAATITLPLYAAAVGA